MMNIGLLLLFKKHTVTLIEQTKTKPQETVEIKMKKQLQSFSFNPRIIFSEEEKWRLAVISNEATDYVLIITDENNSFSFIIPGHWNSEDGEELNKKIYYFLNH